MLASTPQRLLRRFARLVTPPNNAGLANLVWFLIVLSSRSDVVERIQPNQNGRRKTSKIDLKVILCAPAA